MEQSDRRMKERDRSIAITTRAIDQWKRCIHKVSNTYIGPAAQGASDAEAHAERAQNVDIPTFSGTETGASQLSDTIRRTDLFPRIGVWYLRDAEVCDLLRARPVRIGRRSGITSNLCPKNHRKSAQMMPCRSQATAALCIACEVTPPHHYRW